MIISIYALIEPATQELRYIGITSNPISRLYKHISDAKSGRGKTYKDKWLRKVFATDQKPEMVILDTCEKSDLDFWEDWYIQYYKSLGCKLTNTTTGGFHPKMSQETRDKISRANKGKKKPDGFGVHMKNRVISEETRQKMREANVGRKMSDESKAKMSAARKGISLSPETIQKMVDYKTGKSLSDATKAKISKSNMGKIGSRNGVQNSEEHNQRISEANTGKKRSDEQRALISQRTKEAMPNTIKIVVTDPLGKINEYRSLRDCSVGVNIIYTTLAQQIIDYGKEEYRGYKFDIDLDTLSEAKRMKLLSARSKRFNKLLAKKNI